MNDRLFDPGGPIGQLGLDALDAHAIGPDPQVNRAQIVRALAHDIRQPQSALSNALAALKTQLTDREHIVLVQTALAAHREQQWVTDQILDFLRVMVPEFRPTQKSVGLQGVLQGIASSYELHAREKHIQIVVHPTSVAVISDTQYLHRVFGNLVVNAIRHSNGTRVLVGVRRRGNGCVAEIRDNGTGISCRHVEDIFEPGWRGEPPPGKPKSPGGGMGMYIVRAAVRALEGTIEVKTALGAGTLVRVYLPGPISRVAPVVPWPKGDIGSLHGKIVAIIDDQANVLDTMRVRFEQLGAAVVAEDNEIEFIGKVAQLKRPPDLCILDFMLGTSSTAIRCLAMIRQRWGADQIKAIILTGNPHHPELRNITNAPVIEKPLNEANLRKIAAVLAGDLKWDPALFT
jgi:two-component system, sensor histidine kinase